MDYTGLLIFIIIGAVAGWQAGILMKEKGLSLVGRIIIGIVGAFAGGLFFGLFGLIASIVTAVLLFFAWIITKSKNQS